MELGPLHNPYQAPDPDHAGVGTDMSLSIFSLPDVLPPLAAVEWRIASMLVLETSREAVAEIRARTAGFGSTDIEVAQTADSVLDMIGYASRPIDVIMLGAGAMAPAAAHVLAMLRRQATPFVAIGHSLGEPRTGHGWRDYAGVATLVNLRDEARWPRRVAAAFEMGLTVGRIVRTGRVPWNIEADVANAIYGADPGDPFPRRRD